MPPAKARGLVSLRFQVSLDSCLLHFIVRGPAKASRRPKRMANCIRCGRNLPSFSFGKKVCSWCVQHEAAQRGEESENAVQRVEPAPWLRRQSTSMVVTQVIFGINVAVFLGMLLAGVSIL